MRDSNDPALQAGRRLSEYIVGTAAVPHDDAFSQILLATIIRSKRTFDAISHLVGNQLDTQAAMLARPLFEDMVVAHWLDYNRSDPDWLVDRFFTHRDAMPLDQLEMEKRYRWSLGAPLTSTPEDELRRRQNELGKAFRGRARRDWWDPGTQGHGIGQPIGLEGLVQILEDAALRHERYDPRFAGGQEPMLRKMEAILVSWFSRQLHHTAVGLPFQPQPTGAPSLINDPIVGWRTLFSAYWSYGQQVYLLHDHFGWDVTAYDDLFIEGLIQIGAVRLDHEQLEVGVQRIDPLRIPRTNWRQSRSEGSQ